jgi:dihydrofolate reductase
MSRIVITEFLSLDGVMEDPRWTFGFDRGPEGDKFKLDELFAADALLLGRVTYEHFAQAWPGITDEEGFADRMNTMPKYVVSRSLSDADATWGDTTVLRGDPVAELRALREKPTGEMLVAGSGQLARALISEGLFDELRLMVFPVILGAGIRLSPEGRVAARLALTGAQQINDGIMLMTYRPAAQPSGPRLNGAQS